MNNYLKAIEAIPMDKPEDFIFGWPFIQDAAHGASVNAGWWTDPNTRQAVDAESKVPEKLCLCHSEISEAYEALLTNGMDDKLPNRHGFEVEMADLVIRVADLAGALNIKLGATMPMVQKKPENLDYAGLILIECHAAISRAMEGHRKAAMDREFPQWEALEIGLARAVMLAWWGCKDLGFNLPAAIAEKMAFNAVRPDHKLENRAKDGGKRY